MASPERGVLNRGQGKCGQSSLGGTHPPRARQAPPGHCCLPAPMEKGSGSASAWLGGELPPPPGAPVGPTLYACRTPPLSAMFSPSVLNPFTCTSEMGWQDSLGPLPGTPRGQGLCCLLRSAFLPGPKSSSSRGRPCTLTASRSAGLSACSTSRACCCPCRSSGLVGAEAGCSPAPGLRARAPRNPVPGAPVCEQKAGPGRAHMGQHVATVAQAGRARSLVVFHAIPRLGPGVSGPRLPEARSLNDSYCDAQTL